MKGGGCIIYIRGNIHYVICEELTKTPNTEPVWCRVTTMTGFLLVGICYHSTSVDLEKELALQDVTRRACAACNNVVIFGDFKQSRRGKVPRTYPRFISRTTRPC